MIILLLFYDHHTGHPGEELGDFVGAKVYCMYTLADLN